VLGWVGLARCTWAEFEAPHAGADHPSCGPPLLRLTGRHTALTPAALAPLCPLQESQALQTKQRALQAALASSQKEAREAAGLQERLSGLAAELEASQKEAAAASEQLTFAHSRTAVLEKAYAAAVEVSRWRKHVWCRMDRSSGMPAWRAGLTRAAAYVSYVCASQPVQVIQSTTAPCPICLIALQETHSLQSKQRQLQAALAEAQKEARAAVGQSDRLATLQVRLGLWFSSCHVFPALHLPALSVGLGE